MKVEGTIGPPPLVKSVSCQYSGLVTDNRSPQIRSRMMAAVRQKDTWPEVTVRRLLHREGYRYSLHRRDLPGRPDLVFGPRKKVIFVHGCFWHGHDCGKGKLPKSRLEYWGPKIEANKQRDSRNIGSLEDSGWRVCVVWQCELTDEAGLITHLIDFLESPHP